MPRTPLKLGLIDISGYDPERIGVLTFRTQYAGVPAHHQIVLSPEGDLRTAAKHLFGAIRYLDSLGLSLILAEELPEMGIGRAINDRLRRASAVARNV